MKLSGAEAQQLAIMKEVLYDQHEVSKTYFIIYEEQEDCIKYSCSFFICIYIFILALHFLVKNSELLH